MKIRTFGFYILMGSLIFVFIPEKGEAQSYRSFSSEKERILEQTRWMIGPFRIFPRFRIRDVGYDGSVYYGRVDEKPVTDYTATLSPEVTAHLLFRDYLIFSFTENPEYVYYLEEVRERRWNHNFSPEAKLLFFNRVVLGGSYSYQNRRYRATSEFDVRANELRQGYQGSIFYETPRETSFGFNFRKEDISYEDVDYGGEEIYLSRILNREETSYEGEFNYQVFTRSFLFIRGGQTEHEFENLDASWRNSYSRYLFAGLRFPLLGRIQGQVSIGYKELIPNKENIDGFSGLAADSRIEYRLRRFRFRGEYRRDSRFSYWTNNLYFVENRYIGGISFYLTRFFRLDYTYNYGIGNYPEIETIRLEDGSLAEIKREDKYTTHTLGFVVRIVENVGIGINVNYWDRDSNVYYADRDRMFIGGYLTYDF